MKYLHRHPSEINLSLQEMAEVAYMGELIDEQQVHLATAGGLL